MNKTQTSSRFGVASKGAAIVLSATLLASSFSLLGGTFVAPEVDAAGSSVDFMVDDQQDGSILQCFNWSFTAIKNNMAKIAEQGFTAVQTSPIQTTKEGTAGKTAKGSWWVQYQPADFTIETNANGTGALGTASEFRAMCDEAHKYGVRVIVDAVLNHMANKNKNDLSPAIPEKYRNNSNFWHDISKNSWYASRQDITQYCMDGVPDLNTGSSDVQNAATSFLKECIDCGADGFRFDGAKHIEVPVDSGFGSQFWPNVLGATTSYAQSTRGITPYYYGEVLDKPTGDNDISNGQTVANSYTQYMSVTMSGVSNSIRSSVNSGDANGAKRSDYGFDDGSTSISGKKAVLWNESHDTYQAGNSSGVSDYKVNQTWALVGSRATSCGMYLARPSNWGSAKMGQGDVTAWANTEVKAVNEFNNAFVGQTEYLSSSGSIAYNERGTTGVVIVNVSGGATSVSVAAHKMVAGDYVDQVTGNAFKVENGQIKGQIGNTGIAVVYNAGPVIKPAVVSASPAGGSFTTTVTATLNVKNAASGSYTTSDGKSGTYRNGDTITFGSGVAIGGSVTLTLKATGEDGVEKTQPYTFTKKDPSAVTTIYFDNTSYKWSNVYAYVYADGTGTESSTYQSSTVYESSSDPVPSGQIIFSDTLGWGNVNAYFFNDSGAVGTGWPGSTMDYNGTNDYGQKQFKISVPSGAKKVVFNNGSGTKTGDVVLTGATGYYCDGSPNNVKSWTSSGSGASTVTENAKWPGVKMTQDASTGYYAYVVPDNLVNGKVVFSDGVEGTTNRYPVSETAGGLAINDTSMIFKAGNTWEPYTVVPVPPDPKVPTVTCDKTSGTTFTTETFDIKLSLVNAASGTYTIDGGPQKAITSGQTVTIGEGKIGDTEVTVDTTAVGSDGTTKSYTFKFNKKYVVKTTSSSAALSSKYKTNPNGNGKQATITIDGDASDWSEDMLIAQGAAWDVANHWKGGHENCVLDTYALFAAWDDTNLYIGWQMVNTTDTWANPGDGSLSDGGRVLNVPLILALSVDPSSTSMSNKNTDGNPIWGQKMGLTFTTHVDRLFYMSGVAGSGKPSMFKAVDAEGNTNYKEGCVGYTEGGIDYKMAKTNICSSIIGLNSSDSPSDVASDSADWVDYKTFQGSKGVHDTTYDSFYEMKIPLATLGITKEYLTTNGIGAMVIATRGESGLDCIPFDDTMLDNAKGDYHAGDNTSLEKEDDDVITVPFARIGKDGDTPTPPPTPVTTALQANFGTNKSAPQLSSTALNIKAIGMGGTAPYTYTFKVDGKVVKANSATDNCSWTPTTNGRHTLTCIVKDSTGKTATEEKTFTSEGGDTPIPPDPETLVNNSTVSKSRITVGQTVTLTGAASGGTAPYTFCYQYNKSGESTWNNIGTAFGTATSASFKPSVAGSFNLRVTVQDSTGTKVAKKFSLTVDPSTSTLVNNSTSSATTVNVNGTVTLKGAASGGTTPYTYAYFWKLASRSSWNKITDGFVSATSATYKPTAAGSYNLMVRVKDKNGDTKDKQFNLTVKDAALKNTSTVNSTSLTAGSALIMYGSANGGTSPYTYLYLYKAPGASSWTKASSDYVSDTQLAVRLTAAGTYTVKIRAKDKTGTTADKDYSVVVSGSVLSNKSTASATSIAAGAAVVLKGAASGGTTPYKFAYFYKLASRSSWKKASDGFVSDTAVAVKFDNAGSYNLMVRVQDKSGKMADKTFNLTVTSSPLTNNSSLSATSVATGTAVTIKGAAAGGKTPYTFFYAYKLSTASSYTRLTSDFVSATSKSFTPADVGTYNVLVKVKDAAGTIAEKKLTLKVTGSALTNNSSLSASSIALGSSVTLKGAAAGGKSPYTYFYAYKLSTAGSYTRVTSDFVSATSKTITPDKAGKYNVMIKVKDAAGTVAEKTLTLNVTNAALTNNSKVVASSIALGNSITLNGVATGGTSPYTYFYAYKLSTNGSYTRATSDFVSSQTVTIKPTAKGTYDVLIKVKDATGTVVAKNLTFKVT